MRLGSNSGTLTEEFVDLIKEVGKLMQHAISAQEMLENRDAAYGLVWFLHNTSTLKGHLISAAFCVDTQERPLSVLQRYADVEPPDEHISLHDLGTLFATFEQKIERLKLAYTSFLEENRPAKTFFKAAEQQLKLMSWNLAQSKEAL